MVKFDTIGPEKILEVYDPETGMRGFTVIDNTNRGPGKGGIRMTPSVTVEEVAKLARTMSFKNALADLPFGGGKSGIVANARELTKDQKMSIVAAFAKAIKAVCPNEYVAAPDMNMAEEEMEVFAKANGDLNSTTGKPATLCADHACGIPHELGSTGYGVFHSTMVALKHMKLNPKKVTFAVEGFGNVGTFAARYLTEAGAKLVAVSDSRGMLYNPKGIDFDKVLKVKHEERTVTNYKPGKVMKGPQIVEVKCDVLITAAIPNLVNEKNYKKIKAKLLVEGSNIPMTHKVEDNLHERGVVVIPDFVANAGGVISSYVEWKGGDAKEVFPLVEKKIKASTKAVLERAEKHGMSPRDAALELAELKLMRKRRK